MADGAHLTLNLDDATAERLADAARLAGMTPEAYALERLSADLHTSPHDWTETDRRLAELDRTGECVTLEEALGEFRNQVEVGLAAKAAR